MPLVFRLSLTLSSDPSTFDQCPLTKQKNRAELLVLRNSHHLLPVPAYDVAGRLLTPTAYRRCLEGAIAEVHFTLLHRAIDAYGGHIVFIRVLVPPPPLSLPRAGLPHMNVLEFTAVCENLDKSKMFQQSG
ncbi:hypothetical protein EDD16DRAFT_1652623 [Pisolithus croceorrhizus]|nr:hypothetical protein EDD16DRAFT_1652623 [Pisolithus croceorrhizus]